MGFGSLEIQLEEGVAVEELVKDSGSNKPNSAMGIRRLDGENRNYSPKKDLRSYLACGRNPSDEESNPDNVGGKFDLPEFHSSFKAPSSRVKRYGEKNICMGRIRCNKNAKPHPWIMGGDFIGAGRNKESRS
ncbi:hypothetical protein V6N11_082459 [Hibiscus sabdariffa]|uniref:Uncharacterized protein n=2 Tax=Hibiscus sabdariffa TaxID=183260 RepID=A0ABR2BTT9_9ROSI